MSPQNPHVSNTFVWGPQFCNLNKITKFAQPKTVKKKPFFLTCIAGLYPLVKTKGPKAVFSANGRISGRTPYSRPTAVFLAKGRVNDQRS
jgi:hypothetical protein